jgi:dTDP-4-dehydrorhamnose reductase
MVGGGLAAESATSTEFELLTTQRLDRSAPRYLDVETAHPDMIRVLLSGLAPEYVINCIGIVNSLVDPNDCGLMGTAISVNALFPHRLAKATEGLGTRVIHISTDAVFSGLKSGPYVESDPTDAVDEYGRTKVLGECRSSNVINVRCSIVGRDPARGRGLLEWMLRVPDGDHVNGYFNQMWNGVTSRQLARFCLTLIQYELFGAARMDGHVLHLCPNASISKYDLLCLWRDVTGKPVIIGKTEAPRAGASRVLASEHDTWRKAVPAAVSWSELLRECI